MYAVTSEGMAALAGYPAVVGISPWMTTVTSGRSVKIRFTRSLARSAAVAVLSSLLRSLTPMCRSTTSGCAAASQPSIPLRIPWIS